VQRRQSLVADRSFVVELNDESHITDFGAIMPKSERDEVLSVLVRASHTSGIRNRVLVDLVCSEHSILMVSPFSRRPASFRPCWMNW